ncbi:MAG: Rossmann-like domain-containing protein [Acetivibrio ethanolgignens]
MKNFFELYDVLLQGIQENAVVMNAMRGNCWTAVETGSSFGMAMTTLGDTVPKMLSSDYTGMPLRELAEAAKSWNLTEAGFGMAAINAFYNTPARLEQLDAYEPFDNYCTDGLDLCGKHIGVVGHLNMLQPIYAQAASVRILERSPQPGDYLDTACDWLLPQCDVVIMTASTLVNKTLPHLLELSKDAYTILVGPSCPMCPGLLELGIDRIAGLVITDMEGMKLKIIHEIPGSPYSMGIPFLLRRECL